MVTEEELLREAEEAEKDLEKEEESSRRSPLWIIMALGLALLIVAMVLPAKYFGQDKNPHDIPSLEDVQDLVVLSSCVNVTTMLGCIHPAEVKAVANKIVVSSCPDNKVCHAKALYYFVRDEVYYVSDPPDEYYESAAETILTGGADCDGNAILLANLLQATGFHTRFVYVPRHTYVQMLLPSAPGRYKDDGNWINLDPTCDYCEFGEIPDSSKGVPKSYLG
ncbi:transglutaminase family protein [Thermoproteota archaeon]